MYVSCNVEQHGLTHVQPRKFYNTNKVFYKSAPMCVFCVLQLYKLGWSASLPKQWVDCVNSQIVKVFEQSKESEERTSPLCNLSCQVPSTEHLVYISAAGKLSSSSRNNEEQEGCKRHWCIFCYYYYFIYLDTDWSIWAHKEVDSQGNRSGVKTLQSTQAQTSDSDPPAVHKPQTPLLLSSAVSS